MSTDKRLDQEFLRASIISLTFVMAGQIGREYHSADGSYLFSQFHRHHFSNFFDGACITGITTSYLKDLLKSSWQKAATTSAAFSISAGIAFETLQAYEPERTFDYVDCSAYAISAIAFSMYVRHRENQEKPILNYKKRPYC